MKLDFLNYKKQFDDSGYFICKNFFQKDFVLQLLHEIEKSKDTVKYFDNLNNLRRIEKLYNKGKQLKNLNEKISHLLNDVFGEQFLIFKDKFNAKPPGGEGFFAHYDGIFHFINSNNEKKKDGMNMGIFL